LTSNLTQEVAAFDTFLTEIHSLLAAKWGKCYLDQLSRLKTNFALNDMEDHVEIIEQDASDKVDKLRFTTNIDALSRIVTDDPQHRQ
jgi:hypothetical protein